MKLNLSFTYSTRRNCLAVMFIADWIFWPAVGSGCSFAICFPIAMSVSDGPHSSSIAIRIFSSHTERSRELNVAGSLMLHMPLFVFLCRAV